MSARKLILVTGGARSGKSTFAEQIALKMSSHPIYLATATVLDEEFRDRVNRHQARRGPEWTTVEEPLFLGDLAFSSDVILLDCLTLWSTNAFFHCHEETDKTLDFLKNEFARLLPSTGTLIAVTNEIGMGGVSDNPLVRKFTDLQGWMNQYVASLADEVYLLVSGIPLKIK